MSAEDRQGVDLRLGPIVDHQRCDDQQEDVPVPLGADAGERSEQRVVEQAAEFLTETRGTGQLHATFDGYEPWQGEIRTRPNGSLVADRSGATTQFALLNLQDRGQLFVAPGVDVYEGMIVGENARAEDMDVNPAKEKKLSNVRSATGDELVRLAPPRAMSLDQALEFIREDEAVEVTPEAVRLRKAELTAAVRARSAKRAKGGGAPV